MIRNIVQSLATVAFSLLLLTVEPAPAATMVLDFEGLADNEPVNSYYNGGMGGSGSGPGPYYGIVFPSTSRAVIDADAVSGATGNFANEPSPSTTLTFVYVSDDMLIDIVDVVTGFTGGLSFFYSARYSHLSAVYVYGGLGGTGDVLASIPLAANWNDDSCSGDPTGVYCHWDPVGVTFSGTAYSLGFSGYERHIGFDNITLGSATPISTVPEPGTLMLLSTSLLGLVWRRRCG